MLPSIVATLFFCLPGFAHYAGDCGENSYRGDSYGLGIEVGFKGTILPEPNLLDRSCFNQGVAKGREVQNDSLSFDCEGSFESGFEEGFETSVSSVGNACYNAGYKAGRAKLNIAARESNEAVAGSDCVKEYQRGQEDAEAHRFASPGFGEPEASCYKLGFNDVKNRWY